jgi:hypothetical protein
MTNILFKDTTTNFKVNGAQIVAFEIECRLRQGFPLASYLF